MTDKPAAPAPEPVAWVHRSQHDFFLRVPPIQPQFWIPLYVHPAAPAPVVVHEPQQSDPQAGKALTGEPQVDAIMALADAYGARCLAIHDGARPIDGSKYRAALRAAVEQLVRERDAAIALLKEARAMVYDAADAEGLEWNTAQNILARIDALLMPGRPDVSSHTKT